MPNSFNRLMMKSLTGCCPDDPDKKVFAVGSYLVSLFVSIRNNVGRWVGWKDRWILVLSETKYTPKLMASLWAKQWNIAIYNLILKDDIIVAEFK